MKKSMKTNNMKTLIFLLLGFSATAQIATDSTGNERWQWKDGEWIELKIEDSSWTNTFKFREDTLTEQFIHISTVSPIFYPLMVVSGDSKLTLDTCRVITIKGDTMEVIRQMIRGMLQDYTIEFCDPPISATKEMRVEYKKNYLSDYDTTGLYWDSGVGIGQTPRQELHIVDTILLKSIAAGAYTSAIMPSTLNGYTFLSDSIPLGLSAIPYRPTIRGWDNNSRVEAKWTEHVEILSEVEYLDIHNHDWVFEVQNEYGAVATCLVFHGPCGCPNTWPNQKQICKTCGLHLRVYQTCETVKDTRESYEDVVKRFK